MDTDKPSLPQMYKQNLLGSTELDSEDFTYFSLFLIRFFPNFVASGCVGMGNSHHQGQFLAPKGQLFFWEASVAKCQEVTSITVHATSFPGGDSELTIANPYLGRGYTVSVPESVPTFARWPSSILISAFCICQAPFRFS